MEIIPNVLAQRYATESLKAWWTPKAKIKLERAFWIAVMRAQKELGINIPDDAIEAYEKAKDNVHLGSIAQREASTRHDVKARIDEFCELAGHQHIHKGMTSRDLTENIEQLQVLISLKYIRRKVIAALELLAQKADQYKTFVITSRTHNVPAQFTTYGKRLAMHGEEILQALNKFSTLTETYHFRGLKGAVGTQVDLASLFNGDLTRVQLLEQKVMEYLGAPATYKNVGQVYPRSQDFEVVSAIFALSSGIANFALTMRLMAGQDLVSEGFLRGQTGSSAMPHKMNTRSCERIGGFHTLLKGYLTMAGDLTGNQWNEGDVSCSVPRRVFMGDSFFALDGMLETFFSILSQMEVLEGPIMQENQKYAPFLISTQFLMEAVKAGTGREAAHASIKEHALATIQGLRNGSITQNDLIDRLAADKRLGLGKAVLEKVLDDAHSNLGMAIHQVSAFTMDVNDWLEKYPEAKEYEPEPIL